MNKITKLSLDEVIVATLNRYGVRTSAADLMLWLEDLEGIPEVAAIAAFRAHRTDPDKGKFAPTAADIIRRVAGGKEEHARFAWSEVRRAIRMIGPYQSVKFDDPLIPTIIDEMGGWGRLNEMSSESVPFRAKEFIERYVTYASRGMVPEHALGYLRGEHDTPPVALPAIGAKPKPLQLAPLRELPLATPEQIAHAKATFQPGKPVELKIIPESVLRRA